MGVGWVVRKHNAGLKRRAPNAVVTIVLIQLEASNSDRQELLVDMSLPDCHAAWLPDHRLPAASGHLRAAAAAATRILPLWRSTVRGNESVAQWCATSMHMWVQPEDDLAATTEP